MLYTIKLNLITTIIKTKEIRMQHTKFFFSSHSVLFLCLAGKNLITINKLKWTIYIWYANKIKSFLKKKIIVTKLQKEEKNE